MLGHHDTQHNDIRHNDSQKNNKKTPQSIIPLTIVMLSVICLCLVLQISPLVGLRAARVGTPEVPIMLSVIMMNVVMPSAVAPILDFAENACQGKNALAYLVRTSEQVL